MLIRIQSATPLVEQLSKTLIHLCEEIDLDKIHLNALLHFMQAL